MKNNWKVHIELVSYLALFFAFFFIIFLGVTDAHKREQEIRKNSNNIMRVENFKNFVVIYTNWLKNGQEIYLQEIDSKSSSKYMLVLPDKKPISSGDTIMLYKGGVNFQVTCEPWHYN